MGRPHCCRTITRGPSCEVFAPAGAPAGGEVILTLDELEAIRWADSEGLYQEEAAVRMGVSRQTFGRTLQSARTKVARAIIGGHALRIEGGRIRWQGRIELGQPVVGPHSTGGRKMRVAVASDDQITVSSHFGKSRFFVIFDIDEQNVKGREVREVRGGCACHGGSHPGDGTVTDVIADCQVVVTAGIGQGAIQRLAEKGIGVQLTSAGRQTVEGALREFVAGTTGAPSAPCRCHHTGGPVDLTNKL